MVIFGPTISPTWPPLVKFQKLPSMKPDSGLPGRIRYFWLTIDIWYDQSAAYKIGEIIVLPQMLQSRREERE